MPDLTPTEIVGDALAGWVRSMGGDPGWLRPYGAARVVLDALTAAGRLLPEGGQTRTEWRVGYDVKGIGLHKTLAHDEEGARRLLAQVRARFGPHVVAAAVQTRVVAAGPWVAVDQEATDAQ